ncbi:hypothetical protein MES5069_220122 [Mesorhizobium escarrei]|uniref:Uncharacterized protein n=1 Tax=Mesorhizobium escarrei TaxID=666018 RepID=A0ABM9DRP6_9HYPH|nr:hypothetical protein MES5069_220122 [Mesorhizobium escarrei]
MPSFRVLVRSTQSLLDRFEPLSGFTVIDGVPGQDSRRCSPGPVLARVSRRPKPLGTLRSIARGGFGRHPLTD